MKFWEDEMDKVVLKNYNTKMRAKQIAELLGVTKNAVIGRAKRLGLSRTKESRVKSHKPLAPYGNWRRKSWDRVQRMFRLRPDKPRPDSVPVVFKPGGIAIMGLTNDTCRFPISGVKSETLYCGAETYSKKSYCLKHCRVAFYEFKG